MAKFKINQRVTVIVTDARTSAWKGEPLIVVGLPGSEPRMPECYCVEPENGPLPLPPGFLPCALEESLRPLLPSSDTYHPADTSIDDLMRSLRETEHV